MLQEMVIWLLGWYMVAVPVSKAQGETPTKLFWTVELSLFGICILSYALQRVRMRTGHRERYLFIPGVVLIAELSSFMYHWARYVAGFSETWGIIWGFILASVTLRMVQCVIPKYEYISNQGESC